MSSADQRRNNYTTKKSILSPFNCAVQWIPLTMRQRTWYCFVLPCGISLSPTVPEKKNRENEKLPVKFVLKMVVHSDVEFWMLTTFT